MQVRRVLAVCGVVLLATLSSAPAWADATYPPAGPSVSPTVTPSTSPTVTPSNSPSVAPSATVKGEKLTKPTKSTSGSSLPFTGADIAAITAAGLACLAVGTVALTGARRRRGRSQ